MRPAAAAALLAACAAAPLRDDPTHPWIELTSDHFVVWTDVPSARARSTVVELEESRAVIVGAFFGGGDDPPAPPARAILLRRWSDWTGLALPDDNAARSVPAHFSPFLESVARLAAESPHAPVERAAHHQHELAHVIVETLVGPSPPWLVEGVAEAVDDVAFARPGGTTRIRLVPEDLALYTPTRVADVIAEPAPGTSGYNATSQLLVAYLVEKDRRALLAHRRRLLATRFAPTVRPFSQDAKTIERELVAWLRSGRHLELRVRTPATRPRIQERRLSPADVHVVRGTLDRRGAIGEQGDRERRIEHARAAIAADPFHVAGHALLFLARPQAVRVEDARKVVGAHGEEWRAWALLHLVATGEERVGAAARVCALAGDHPAPATTLSIRCDELRTAP
jgi:hypothetical protein